MDPIEDGDDDASHLGDIMDDFYALMYETAVLVGPTGTSPLKTKDSSKKKSGCDSPPRASSPIHDAYKKPSSGGPSVSVSASTFLSREIMDALLPPKTWQDSQGKWQRMVSMLPATRTETQRLHETFDHLLEKYQARVHTICAVREKYFLQIFEELIREVTCECPERGLMLLRVHNELRLRVEAYQTLYHNSIAYGRQKAVQAEAGVTELEQEICRLKAEHELLVSKRKELELKLTTVEEQRSEEKKKRHLRHAHTVQFLRTQHQELEFFHHEMTQDSPWK
ncbi:Axonemal dynein light chain [Phytophthora infestans]|uniref:Axonemal dynein light chain n=1 Tax=Phytophthora infestans TaxID=4787 RepID=A0A833T3F6_PHYIN|nr:Axonemal dynein light chain [Phytophthora infestans]